MTTKKTEPKTKVDSSDITPKIVLPSSPSSQPLPLYVIAIIVVVCLVVLVFLVGYQSQPKPAPVLTGTYKLGKTAPDHAYPDPQKTPGDVYRNITEKDICVSGYSATVRNVPQSLKKKVYAQYGVAYPQPKGTIEVDHFVSLQLGGSNDIKNLWPEFEEPRPGFREKDVVENYIKKQICDGKITIKEGQKAIAEDWYKVYLEMKGEKDTSDNGDDDGK